MAMDHAERDRAFAELLAAVIERHTVASRLRDTADLADASLSRALRVGDAVRRALRAGGSARPDDDDFRQLDDLATQLDAAIERTLAATCAVALRRAIAADRKDEAAGLALQLFAGLTPVATLPSHVYVGLGARRRSRDGETLVHPGVLAAEIAALQRDGIGPASGSSGACDEAVLPEPIALAPSFAACATEIALRRPAGDLGSALLEDTASADLLVFGRCVAGPFTTVLAPDADDEWWAAGTTSYASYCAQLSAELARRGIAVERAG
jgi:hypothetical protein